MEQEIWKHINGYEGLYEISNLGRVKSITRNIKSTKSENWSINITGRVLSIKTSKNGYSHISLSFNNKSRTFLIHRLVAEAFIPNPENNLQVNHLDGLKKNNHSSNLEWCTASQNQNHRFIALGHAGTLKGKKKDKSQIKNHKKCFIKNIHTNEIITFDSIKECCVFLEVANSLISKSIKRNHIIKKKYTAFY